METPDKWIVIKITYENGEILYKVFATWYGGYLGSDSWRMNSGIKDVDVQSDDCYIDFIGYSGSVYRCINGRYGTNAFSQSVLNKAIEGAIKAGVSIEVLPENTDWINLLNKL